MRGKCIIWTGAKNSKGYGHRWIKCEDGSLKDVLVHRDEYRKHNGSIPEGMQVRHLCGNKLCINPNHLAIGTQSDNEQDKRKNGTYFHRWRYYQLNPNEER